MVKIALIGAGYWGKNWYRTIIEAKKAGYGSAELVAVVDPAGTGNLGAGLDGVCCHATSYCSDSGQFSCACGS